MKKIEKIMKKVVTVAIMLMPVMVEGYERNLEYVTCGDATGIPKVVPQLTSAAYTLLIIGTPIILILFSIVALVKAITAGNQDDIAKGRNKLIKKFIAAGLVFFVAGVVQFVVTRSADATEKESVIGCVNCFLYNEGCASAADSGNQVKVPTGNPTGNNTGNNSGNNTGNNTGNNSGNNTGNNTGNNAENNNSNSTRHTSSINNRTYTLYSQSDSRWKSTKYPDRCNNCIKRLYDYFSRCRIIAI
jgi:hypothetical protein